MQTIPALSIDFDEFERQIQAFINDLKSLPGEVLKIEPPLTGRHSLLKNSQKKGIISHSDYTAELNKILYAYIELVTLIKDKDIYMESE